MTKVRNNFLTKVAALLLSFAMLLGMLPLSYITAFALNGSDYGTFSIISSGGSVTDANGESAVATFNDVSLNWSAADPSVGRTSDGWWIGVKMTAPAGMTTSADFAGASGDPNNTDGVTYQRCTSAANDTWTSPSSFWRAQDSNISAESTERYLTMWGMINEQYINEALATGSAIYYKWRFDWDKDGDYEQTATLKVEPQNIKLIKDSVQVYPATTGLGTVTPYGDKLTVEGDANSNYIKVSYSADTVLNWVEKNETIGRMQDGWWAGVKMTAPSALQNAADFAGASGDPINTTDCISYQSKSSDGWSAAKSFWRNKDSASSATEHFIGLWGLLNVEYLKRATTTLSYMWRFDWNNDRVYEQIVIIEIEPSHITLNNESGIQVYPELGDVTTYTGGTVTGTKSGNVVVDVSDDVTLNWSPKDLSIGRYTDGWWAGIKITAPENIVLTEDDDVKYQSKVGDNDWSKVKSFYNNQDSAKDAAIHYMGMWTVLDRTKLSTAIANHQKLTTQWRFDWDKDGVYEQLVTLNIDPQKITLKRVDRTDFVFTDAATNKEVWVGDGSFVNKAESILAPGTVTYEIDAANTTASNAAVDNNGKVTFTSIGKITVKATIAEDDVYNAKTISYSFNVVKKQPENLKFRIEVPSDITFGNNIIYENTINVPGDCKVKYSIKSQEKLETGDSDVSENPVATIDENTGTVTVKRSGKITVLATITDDDPKYKDKTAEYSLTIKKAEQTGFAFTANSPESLVYSTTAYDTVNVEGGQVEGTAIKYEITEGADVAEIDGSKIKTLKAGDFKLSVTKPGNDCYNPVTINREMKVTLAEQTTFAFTYPTPNNIKWNDANGNKFTNVAKDGESTGAVTYKVTQGAENTKFDNAEQPAEVTFTQAGTYTIEATKAADNKYAEATITYTIVVEKADQKFTFTDGKDVVKNYGVLEYTNTSLSPDDATAADKKGHGEGAYTYSIEENDIGAQINPTTGKITFTDSEKKIGKVKVTVTRAEDERYNSWSDSYTIEIKYPTNPTTPYTIDKELNSNGWYDGDIKIYAPDGYKISYDNELRSTTDWDSYVPYYTEGTTCPVIYLKADNGDITDAITVTGYQMDNSAPVNLKIDYTTSFFDKIGEVLFGINAETVNVTLSAEDVVSGIDYVWYSLDNGTTYPENQKVELINGEYTFSIPAQFRNKIEFKAYDMAGHMTMLKDKAELVVDAISPKINVSYNYFESKHQEVDNIIYSNDKVELTFNLTVDNFDLSEKPIVKVNDVEKTMNWSTSGTLTSDSFELNDNGDYVVTFEFTDRLNRTTTYSKEIHIDKDASDILDFTFDKGDVKGTNAEGRIFFDNEQTVTVVIKEHNFRADDVEVIVTADQSSVNSNEYLDDSKKASAWINTATDEWTAKIPFEEDANYTLKVKYTDLALNVKTTDEIKFTVDTTDPAQPTIKLDKKLLDHVLETVTFGFFKAPVEVTISSTDLVAGVKEIKYAYTGTKGEYVTETVEVGETKTAENGSIKFTIPVEKQFKGKITATAYDWSMNDSVEQSIIYDYDNRQIGGIVVDNTPPERTVLLSTAHRVVDADTLEDKEGYVYTSENQNAILYYKDSATLTFMINEANFYKEDVHIFVNGTEMALTEDWQLDSKNQFVGKLTLTDEGDYVVEMTYEDKSENVMTPYKSEKIAIDKTAPTISVKYDPEDAFSHEKYFNTEREATITIVEHNFNAIDVAAEVTAEDFLNNEVAIEDFKKYLANDDSWTHTGDVHTATIIFKENANYTFKIDYEDMRGYKADTYLANDFVVDKVADADEHPEISITYGQNFVNKILSTIFFYKADTTVKITAKDITSAIDYFKISAIPDGSENATNIEIPQNLEVYANGDVKSGTKGFIGTITSEKKDNEFSISFTVPAEFRGKFIATAYDMAHNDSDEYNDSNIVVVDRVTPKVNITYEGSLKDKIDVDVEGQKPIRQSKEIADANTRFVYDGEIVAKITATEANFYEDMTISVTKDNAVAIEGTDYVIGTWLPGTADDEHIKTVTLKTDGDYVITAVYSDKSLNDMDFESDEYSNKTGSKTYVSNIHTIDTTAPEYSITYNNNNVIHNIDSRDYFDANRTATIKVTDRNFRPNEVDFSVIAKDVTATKDITEFTYSNLKSWDSWTQDGIAWTATVPFNVDANYTVEFAYEDIAEHKMVNAETKAVETYSKMFTVDKEAPENLTITYLEPTFVERFIEAITFHFYDAPVKVQISATDDIAGVWHFLYSYVNSDDVSVVNAELINEPIDNENITYEGNKAIATFTIPKAVLTDNNQFRGNIEFTAFDRSENKDDTKDETVVVVDDIAPQIDITYTANSQDTSIHYTKGDSVNADDFKTAGQVYYNGDITAKITVDEANFFEGDKYTDENGTPTGTTVHEIGILLTKTDNDGNVTKIEYLPANSAQMFANETSNKKTIEWVTDATNENIHSFEIVYDENADYELKIKYLDFSGNKSDIESDDQNAVVEIYNSKKVTIDKIDPIIKVEYSNTDVKNTIDNRKYYDKNQIATITVTEHNFRADDMDVDVIAKNVIDEDVSVANFDAQLRNRSNWKHYDDNGNEVNSVTEGDVHVATITYSVDANYTFDIEYADLAKRVSKDYDADLFTVDKTAPTNLTVTYSEPKLWDKILESITFGFYNAQMEVTITADDITSGIYHFKYSYIKSEGVSDVNAELIDQAISDANITYAGKTATAKFNIPKLVLKNDNQFNGTVKFTAYDRSENNTDMADEERIVVDNIKPTSKITYNEPIQNANNISYYAGDINATIVINEANFYSKDVNVTVTKDGTNYPVTVQWKDDSVDVHTGTFTLTEDGDYIVTVKYADRSTNEMDTYESNRLTIDTKAPTVSVSNIKNNSANKDEKYGFTITANDVNIDMNSIKPVLTAVVRDENGNYSTKTISLGDMRTVDAGKTYSFTVENLEDDAVYTLVCTLKDMSGNEYSKIGLADGKEYETVRFSVNRDGSTFAVNEASAKLLEQYYVYSVNEDVVIEEINVDPIENYTVKLNGVALGEGKDYTTTVTDNNGEWSKRTYVVKKSLFEKEGEYSIIVESIDKAETTAFSDVKSLKVAFVVDQTAPVLTISGLEEGGRYQIDEQTVTVIPTDDGGKLNSFKAILLDSDGKEIEVRFEISGDELIKYLEENDGKIIFTVPEGLENQVRIICDDCAVNAEGKTNAYDNTFTKVTVSQSGWVIYYANKPLFYGSIGGVIAIAGGTFSFVFFRKRRKLVP